MSWIRHRDLLILTVTTYTFTTDQRFQTTYHRDTNEWTLHIKWVQDRDAGMYECQISTQPIMSYFVHLNTVGGYLFYIRSLFIYYRFIVYRYNTASKSNTYIIR